MATREDVAELRAGIARLRSPWRGVAVTVPVAALVIGFMVPVLAFAVRPGIAS